MKFFLLTSLMVMVNLAFGKTRDLVTTRLMSTAGAGVGSVLFNEAAVLNPASITYFNNSSIYYQKSKAKVTSESNDRKSNYHPGLEESYIIADTSSAVKGTFSYHHIREDQGRTKRFASALAGPVAEKTAAGFLLQYYTFEFGEDEEKETQWRTDAGITHVYSPKVTLGAVIKDINRKNKENQYFIVGTQIQVSDHLDLILDAGFNLNYAPSKTSLTRIAGQVNIIQNFFLRAGQFNENGTDLKGTSWGFSWVAPKLSIDYAFRRSIATRDSHEFFKDEVLQEHSIAFAVRF